MLWVLHVWGSPPFLSTVLWPQMNKVEKRGAGASQRNRDRRGEAREKSSYTLHFSSHPVLTRWSALEPTGHWKEFLQRIPMSHCESQHWDKPPTSGQLITREVISKGRRGPPSLPDKMQEGEPSFAMRITLGASVSFQRVYKAARINV